MLDSRYSYDFKERAKNRYRSRNINENKFHAWSKNHMFRTTYNDNYAKKKNKLVPLKCSAIPGYKGFVPGLDSDNMHGSSYTPLTRDAFNNPELGNSKMGLSSTG